MTRSMDLLDIVCAPERRKNADPMVEQAHAGAAAQAAALDAAVAAWVALDAPMHKGARAEQEWEALEPDPELAADREWMEDHDFGDPLVEQAQHALKVNTAAAWAALEAAMAASTAIIEARNKEKAAQAAKEKKAERRVLASKWVIGLGLVVWALSSWGDHKITWVILSLGYVTFSVDNFVRNHYNEHKELERQIVQLQTVMRRHLERHHFGEQALMERARKRNPPY